MSAEGAILQAGYFLLDQTPGEEVYPVSLRNRVTAPASTGTRESRPVPAYDDDWEQPQIDLLHLLFGGESAVPETVEVYPLKGLDTKQELSDNVIMSVQQFCDLLGKERPEGWARPTELTEATALGWLAEYLTGPAVAFGAPHMSISAHGEFIFTWWQGPRKLSIYCDEAEVEYLKTWGADVRTEMEDGPFTDITPLIIWLQGDEAHAA